MKKLLIIFVLLVPTWSALLRPGFYFIHDELHLFRLYEFDQCVRSGQLPCRWSANASLGFGQPLFNFYGQVPYWIGEIYHLLGFSFIDSLKLVLATSLVLSGLGMYLLAKKYWTAGSSVLVAVLYVYAPYRAVNVWVRGAVNECIALALFPWIILSFENTLKNPSAKNAIYLAWLVAGLLLTHNLSFLMFSPFLLLMFILRFNSIDRPMKIVRAFALSGFLAAGLSAYYWLPVLMETSFISLLNVTSDYYNYQLHWVTLKQLFISRLWGYGGSTWGPNDTMSLSVGHVQWLIPVAAAVVFLVKRQKPLAKFWLFFLLGLAALFLTHGKSAFIWGWLPFMAYLQFPWRFLGVAVLFMSLTAGFFSRTAPLLVVACLLLNAGFFQSQEWRLYSDASYFSGLSWETAKTYAAKDYWPGQKLPERDVQGQVVSLTGQEIGWRDYVSASVQKYSVVSDFGGTAVFPVAYFPGWRAIVDGKEVSIDKTQDYGLIKVWVPAGRSQIRLVFSDTPARAIGNSISLLCAVFVLGYLLHAK